MLASTTQPSDIHVLRDPTRGGLAASLNEIARSSKVGIIVNEPQIPISWEVRSVCELLGLDPLQAANEGKLVAIVAPDAAPSILAAMREHPLGKDATIVGQVTDRNPGFLTARTAIGGMRIIPMPLGQQLPRIC
jgi:hydrogenase expression/formation protein HypE